MRQALTMLVLLGGISGIVAASGPQIVDGANDVLLTPSIPRVGVTDPAVDLLTVTFTEEAGELVTSIRVSDVQYRPPSWETYYYDVTLATDQHESVHLAAKASRATGWSMYVTCWDGPDFELTCFDDAAPIPVANADQDTVTLRVPTSLIGRGALQPSAIASATYARAIDFRPTAGVQDRAPDTGYGSDYSPEN